MSIENFKKALDLCITYISQKIMPELYFLVLYNLGLTYYLNENQEESLYYLEQIFENGCKKDKILINTGKQLLKIYYSL